MSPGPGYVLRIGVQTLDQAALPGSQCGGQLPIAATDMNDNPAANAGGFEDIAGLIGPSVRRWSQYRKQNRAHAD